MRGKRLGEPETWPEVTGVSTWLEVIWWNLLSNALQHAGPHPKIELGWRQEGESVEFWVADHGPGVAAEKIKKLFHPFHLLQRRYVFRRVVRNQLQRRIMTNTVWGQLLIAGDLASYRAQTLETLGSVGGKRLNDLVPPRRHDSTIGV